MGSARTAKQVVFRDRRGVKKKKIPGGHSYTLGFHRNVLSESSVVFNNSTLVFSKKMGLVGAVRQLDAWALYERASSTEHCKSDECGQRWFSALFLLSQLGLLTSKECWHGARLSGQGHSFC